MVSFKLTTLLVAATLSFGAYAVLNTERATSALDSQAKEHLEGNMAVGFKGSMRKRFLGESTITRRKNKKNKKDKDKKGKKGKKDKKDKKDKKARKKKERKEREEREERERQEREGAEGGEGGEGVEGAEGSDNLPATQPEEENQS